MKTTQKWNQLLKTVLLTGKVVYQWLLSGQVSVFSLFLF